MILAYDPGMSLAESYWQMPVGKTSRCGSGWPGDLMLHASTLVIEMPVYQGGRKLDHAALYKTCTAAGIIIGLWRAHFAWGGHMGTRGLEPPVYAVPRAAIMSQLGVKGGDKELTQHFRWLKLLTGDYDKGGSFRVSGPDWMVNDHLRAAYAVSMFNIADPRNQKYKVPNETL